MGWLACCAVVGARPLDMYVTGEACITLHMIIPSGIPSEECLPRRASLLHRSVLARVNQPGQYYGQSQTSNEHGPQLKEARMPAHIHHFLPVCVVYSTFAFYIA